MPNIKSLAVILVLLLCACSEPTGRPAPVGDYAVLEQLADAYRTVAKGMPVSPGSMPPEGKRQFLEQVFHKAGYDYGATLQALAQEMDITNKDHRDLADLLLLPQVGLAEEDWTEIYSPSEIKAVKAIHQALR
jgi:hypothetical protein